MLDFAGICDKIEDIIHVYVQEFSTTSISQVKELDSKKICNIR